MADEETKETPKRKGKALLLIILMVLLPAGTGAGVYLAVGKKASVAGPKRPTIGPTFPLESFVINLADPGVNRYLKITMELELGNILADEAKKFVPRIRDGILLYLSTFTSEQVKAPKTKLVIKTELLKRANAVLGKGAVKAVYFQEFVTQ